MPPDRLKRRGRVWYAWVPKRGGGTELRSTHCTDRAAARIRAAELEREAVDPAYAAANKAAWSALIDDYYRSRVRLGRAEGSLHHVRVKSGHLVRLLPSDPRAISHQVMCDYIDTRLEEGARRTTIKKEVRVFGAVWKLARKNRLVGLAVDEVMPELDDDYQPGERFLTALEAWALCLALPPHRAAVVAFVCATGCDPGAIGRARPEDVAPDRSTCHVRGTKRETRDRIAPVPLPVQRTMLGWGVEHADGGIGGKLFSNWDSNIRRDLHVACDAAGIPRVSPTDLRRTYGRWLRAAGLEPHLIGAAMGHTDSRMAERVYGKFTPDSLAAQAFARVKHMYEESEKTP